MKYKYNYLLIAIMMIFLLTGLGVNVAQAQDDELARKIMHQVETRDRGDSSVSELEMTLIDKRGKKRVRRIKSYRKDFGGGADTYSIMFFLHPPDVRGTSFLTYDYDDPARDDDQWLYLPALKKEKRIASSDKSGSFMGSDFNYSDMTERKLDDYDYSLIKEDKVGEQGVWVIQAVPRTKDIIDESGYDKSILFVRKDNYVVTRAALWVAGTGGKIKYMDVKKMELVDGIWVNRETRMSTKQGRKTIHRTVLIQKDIAFNQQLRDGMFTVRSMKKGL